jgi:hypothetical protein
MEPNKFTHLKNYEKICLNVMIFQSLMGLWKSRCDVPSGLAKDAFAHPRIVKWWPNLF